MCSGTSEASDSIREEEEAKANRTDALFSRLPDAFHMTERESEREHDRWRDWAREPLHPMLCSHELIQLSPLNKFNQL